MLLYRVIPFKASASAGERFSPSYLPPSRGFGRVDNPGVYRVWYLAADASGAVAETFADHPVWGESTFRYTSDVGSDFWGAVPALVTFQIPDSTAILNLDHASALVGRGLKPTMVVSRARAVTQAWALDIFNETGHSGRTWAGVEWWSLHRPHWRIFGLWGVEPVFMGVEVLHRGHPAVLDAADSLGKVVPGLSGAV